MSKDVKSLCPYCGVGCGLIASTNGHTILKVRGDPQHPANFGKLCPKGSTVHQTLGVHTRLTTAMIRGPEGFADVSPHVAVCEVAERLSSMLAQHGPESIAFYLSGQMTTESQYLASKFAKGCLRTNHCDSNSRLCMSSAAAGMTLSLGSDAPPTCYADIELADTFLFIGSNAAECHPVTFSRVRHRTDKHKARCVDIDPRRTATAQAADIHLALRPGSDLALLNGLLRLVRDWDRLDATFISDHTEGWAELEKTLAEYPPERVSQICGIEQADILAAARILADAKSLITLWTMGVNQSVLGTFTSNAIINLHLATGQIAKPGCGPFSLTGQPNAMGGRDVGYMSHQLPGQRFIADAAHRAEMEKLWGLPEGHLHPLPGYDAVRIFDAAARGGIKALWVIGTNPAASMPNLPVVRAALEKLDLLIVQDAYHPTETTGFAHVLLPAAVNLEQSGTFTNSERCVTLMDQVVPPPGDARPDWWWVQQVAQAMGFVRGMSFRSAADIFDEFARSTAGRPNDQSALHHKLLRDKGPQHWPYPALAHSQPRRYLDRCFPTPTGKARFFAREFVEMEDRPTPRFPLILTTGRVLNQWHTRTKTAHCPALNKLDPAPYLQMHPNDASSLGLQGQQQVQITSRFGACATLLRLDDQTSPGVVFMPIHWNDLWAPSSSPNEAIGDTADPLSRQPALKAIPVRVEAVPHIKQPPLTSVNPALVTL